MTSTTTILRSLSSAAGRRLLCLSRVSFSSLSSAAAAASSRSTTTTTSIFRPSVNLVSGSCRADSNGPARYWVITKATDDKAGQEALANVFRAAEASVEFGGVLVTLRMVLDDLNGLSGENVGRLPDYIEDAIRAAYKRYKAYLDSFGPGEAYLRKKVETELGTKMIHLKMRCSGISSEWEKVTLLGTSGLSGSYVELRS